MWIVTGYTLRSGRKFYAAVSSDKKKLRATTVHDAATRFWIKHRAESAALQFAVAHPVFLGKISVEKLT